MVQRSLELDFRSIETCHTGSGSPLVLQYTNQERTWKKKVEAYNPGLVGKGVRSHS